MSIFIMLSVCSILPHVSPYSFFFFFNDTATTEIYTLSLHDALPICLSPWRCYRRRRNHAKPASHCVASQFGDAGSSHSDQIGRATSELQSRSDLVCRLLLEKKKD